MTTMDSRKVRKVRYVRGSGILLQEDLSDGQSSFVAGIEYEIPNYSDFLRLTEFGDFEEVIDVEPVVEEVVEEPVAEEVVDLPAKKTKLSPAEDKGDKK